VARGEGRKGTAASTVLMNSSAGQASLQIIPNISTIREAQRFLAKYFAPTRLIAAAIPSARPTGRHAYLKFGNRSLPTRDRSECRGAFLGHLGAEMAGRADRGGGGLQHWNHGAAVASAAKQFGIKARIFCRRLQSG